MIAMWFDFPIVVGLKFEKIEKNKLESWIVFW